MKLKKNPEGIRVVALRDGLKFEYEDPSIIPMKVRSGKRVHILNQNTPAVLPDGTEFQGYALCGAGYPSMQYPYGSGEVIAPRELVGTGQTRGSTKITCYRCIKLNALNAGPTLDRSFSPTGLSRGFDSDDDKRRKHEMLPGGREGLYGSELQSTLDLTPEQLRAQVENAMSMSDYWPKQEDFFKVGPPIARTQPGAIEYAEQIGAVDRETGTYPSTSIAAKSIPKKSNPSFKVGDKVSENGRMGKIVAMHTEGTADVLFSDMDFAIRRQGYQLKAVRSNGIKAEVQHMINNAPPSWKAMLKAKVGKVKPTVDEAIYAILKLTPSGAEYGPTGSKRWAVPAAVKADAMKGLRLSFREKYTSASGIGLARAMQLATSPKVWDRSVYRMFAYFERHISDTESARFGDDRDPSNGWMAWLNWGGTPGYEWSAAIKGKQRKLMDGEIGYDRHDRSKRVKQKRKALPIAANPRDKKHGVLVEKYDPKLAQRNAMVQGIYESLVRGHLKEKHNKAFKTKTGVRLDLSSMMSKPTIKRLLGSAFQIGTGVGQKHKFLKKGTQEATKKAIKRSKERAKNKAHLWENVLDYETTLSMARKDHFRILVWKERGKKTKYYVMPLGTFSYSMAKAVEKLRDAEKDLGVAQLPPKTQKKVKRKAPKKRSRRNPTTPEQEAYGSAADPFTKKVVFRMNKDVVITWQDGTRIPIGSYTSFAIQGPEGAFVVKRDVRSTRYLLEGLVESEASPSAFQMKEAIVMETFATDAEENHIRDIWQAPDRTRRGAFKLGDAPVYANILRQWRMLNLERKAPKKYKSGEKRVSALDLIDRTDIIASESNLSTRREVWDALQELLDRGIIKRRGLIKDSGGNSDEYQLPIDGEGILFEFMGLLRAGIGKIDKQTDDIVLSDYALEYDLPTKYRKRYKTTKDGEEEVAYTFEASDMVQYRKRIKGAIYEPVSYKSTFGSAAYKKLLLSRLNEEARKKKVTVKQLVENILLGQSPKIGFFQLGVDAWAKTRFFLEKAAFRDNYFNVPNLPVDINLELEIAAKNLSERLKKKIYYSPLPTTVQTTETGKRSKTPPLIRPTEEMDDTPVEEGYNGPSYLVTLVDQPLAYRAAKDLSEGFNLGGVQVMSRPTQPLKKGTKTWEKVAPQLKPIPYDAELYANSVPFGSLKEMSQSMAFQLAQQPAIFKGEQGILTLQFYDKEPLVDPTELRKAHRAKGNKAHHYKLGIAADVKRYKQDLSTKLRVAKPSIIAIIVPPQNKLKDPNMVLAQMNSVLEAVRKVM